MVAKQLQKKANSVLGLATGDTPKKLYKQLIEKYRENKIDFSEVTTFNLDEYFGLRPEHPQSYRSFMQEYFFSQINIPSSQTFVPNGLTSDVENYGAKYEAQIDSAGGIDLQILGIGRDGHIGFNEPGSSLGSLTRVKALTSETISDNARFFNTKEQVPHLAITMGVGSILKAKTCLLLAFGSAKSKAVMEMIEGPITSQVTASALQLHPQTVVFLDEEAAEKLARKKYYHEAEAAQKQLEIFSSDNTPLP